MYPLKRVFIFATLVVFSICDNRDGIKKVHLIFMNHLDVGYDGIHPEIGYINNILNKYFHEYFPRVSALAKELNIKGYTETFKYTTHPWLISLFLDCPSNFTLSGILLKCPNKLEKDQFVEAVKNGYITWHAGPMNMQIELSPLFLIDFCLNISQMLDDRFNIKRKFRTLSQRDVPGMTQAMIPSLIENRIIAVSVGVNGATAPPAVPNAFRWFYKSQYVLALWHPGGYPDNPGTAPNTPGGLSTKDCHVVAGMSDVLCFAFRTDNKGPPVDVREILDYYEILRAEFPHADIKASTFEDYVEQLWYHRRNLPVVKNEIGDTWIQGTQSDHYKMASFKAVTRIFQSCLNKKLCSFSDRKFWNAARFLMKMGEHTFGLNWGGDSINWSNDNFYKVMNYSGYLNLTKEWSSQRQFLDYAIHALGDNPIVSEIHLALSELRTKDSSPDLDRYVSIKFDENRKFRCSSDLTLGFSLSGGINFLKRNDIQYASSQNLLGQFLYSTYNESDFKKTALVYNYNKWGPGFYKNNLTKNFNSESRRWKPRVVSFHKHVIDVCDFWIEAELPVRAVKMYGAPVSVWTHYKLNISTKLHDKLFVDVALFNKSITRLPESLDVMWNPIPHKFAEWKLVKLSKEIDPYSVVLNGSQYQHSVEAVSYTNSTKYRYDQPNGLTVIGLDTSLVSTQTTDLPYPNIFPAPLKPINDSIIGFSHNILNNVWNTNFIYWYPFVKEDRNILSRFQIDII